MGVEWPAYKAPDMSTQVCTQFQKLTQTHANKWAFGKFVLSGMWVTRVSGVKEEGGLAVGAEKLSLANWRLTTYS